MVLYCERNGLTYVRQAREANVKVRVVRNTLAKACCCQGTEYECTQDSVQGAVICWRSQWKILVLLHDIFKDFAKDKRKI